MLAEAEVATAKVKALADCLIAFELCSGGDKQYDKKRIDSADLAESAMRKPVTEFQAYAREQLHGRRPFHWAVEFPEVFERGGFDAFVGNPPFKALKLRDDCSWTQVSAVLSSVDALFEADAHHMTPVWSGPANGVFPVRRFDQVLYDLIAQAHERILIVTFAAHKVGHLCDHLQAAVARGVSLTLILETAEASEGQLSFDALNAFSVLPKGSYSVYYWPLDCRPRNSAGRPGKLHVKCAVVDSTALVGSGNLTDDAFNRNMELGLLVNDASTADALHSHFAALITHHEFMGHMS